MMENKEFVEVELVEKAPDILTECNNGCQRDKGAPQGG